MEITLLFLFVDGAIFKLTAPLDKYLSAACFIMGFIWFPGFNRLRYHQYNIYIDDMNQSNPLYARGLLNSNNKLFARLKGLYICQMISLIPLAFSYLYLYCRKIKGYENEWIKGILIMSMMILLCVWGVFKEYYKKIYWKDFKYTENEDGIWLPFQYITEGTHMGYYQPFNCRYHVPYEDLKKNLKNETAQKNYLLLEEYEKEERELLFFARQEKKEIYILALIHINKYTEKETEYLNREFVNFWKRHMEGVEQETSVSFIFLLCVEEKTKALKKAFLDACCVYHKKNRYRLPAVLVYGEKENLEIIANNTERMHYSQYRKMRRELMDLLKIGLNNEDEDVYPNGKDDGNLLDLLELMQMREDDRNRNYYFKE